MRRLCIPLEMEVNLDDSISTEDHRLAICALVQELFESGPHLKFCAHSEMRDGPETKFHLSADSLTRIGDAIMQQGQGKDISHKDSEVHVTATWTHPN